MSDRAELLDGAALDALLDQVPQLAGKPRTVSELPGGLTNRNYRVRTDTDHLVVRISDESSSLLAVDRDAERENSMRSAEVGVGAAVLGYRPDLGMIVFEYLDSITYDDAAVAANLPAVAEAVRALHGARPFVNRFDYFRVHQGYLQIMQDKGFRMPSGYLDLLPTATRIQAALAEHPEDLVPCHNDLLAANFLHDGNRLRIIDYEYSGMNEPAFDLGNCAQEAGLTDEQLTALVTAYADDHQVTRRLARARLWSIMTSYGWTLWGTIQAGASDIDFDFWSWAMAKYGRAREAFADNGFEDLLDEVGRG